MTSLAPGLTIARFSGPALAGYLDDVARLRMEVFREFPYLYDGTLEYERNYLQTYVRCAQAVVVVAFADGEVVGAATAIPLQFEEANFQQPFITHGYNPARIFYCAESVLRRDFRGQGVGVRFFAEREAHAQSLGGFDFYCFCSVLRPANHPLRPVAWTGLDQFWQKRGYQEYPQLTTTYAWKDIDQPDRTTKTLRFWVKSVAR
ncbi:MAG: GNAT family N-acetyltransferase [Pseudohongiellaceae bacterium]